MQEQRLKFECGGTTTSNGGVSVGERSTPASPVQLVRARAGYLFVLHEDFRLSLYHRKRVQPLASRSVEDRCSTSRSSSTSTSQQSIVSAETVGGHRDSTPQLVLANRNGCVRIASFRADALWLSTVVSAGPPTPVQLTVLPVFAAAASSPFFDENDAQRVVKVADRIDPASPFTEEVHRDRMHVPGERSSAVVSGSASSSAYFGRYHPVFWTCGGSSATSSSGRGSPGGVVQGSSQVYLRPFAVQCGIARQAGRCMSLLSERGHSAKKLEGVGTGRTVVSVFAVTTNVFVVVGSRPFLAAYEIAEAEAYSPPPGAESEDYPAQQERREQGVASSGPRSTFLGELWEEVENTMEEILGNGSGGARRLSQFSQKALDVGRKLGFRSGKQNSLEGAPLPCAPCWTASEGTAETAAQAPDGQTFAILNKHGEISVHRLERGGFDQSKKCFFATSPFLQLVHLWRASGSTSCVMSLCFPTRAHLALGYGAEQGSVKSGRSSSSRKTAARTASMASHALSKIEVWRVADSDRRIRTWSETAGQGSVSSSTHGIVPDARLGCFYALEGLEVPSGEDQENAAEQVTYCSARQLTVQKNASEHAYDARAHHDAASAHSPTDTGNAEINGYETAHEEDTVEQQVENVLRGLIEAKEGLAARPLHCIPWDQPQILLRALRGVKAARQKRLFLASLLTAHVVENEARITAAVSKNGAIVSNVEQRGDPSAPAPGAPENASTAERLLRPSLTTQLVLEKVLADAKLEAEWDLDEVVVNKSGSRGGAESSGGSSSSFREMLRGEARRLADYVDILSQNLTSGERSAAPSRSTSTNVLSARKKAALFGDGDRDEEDDSEEAGSPFHIVARPEVPQSTDDQGKGGHNATNSGVSLLEIVGGPLLLQEKALNCGAAADTTSTPAVDEYCSFLEEEVLRPEEEQEIIDVEQNKHQQSTTSSNVADALYGFSGRGWASLYGVGGLRSAPSTSLPAGFLPSFGGCLDLFVGDAREQDPSSGANNTDSEHRQEGTGGAVRSTSSPDSSSKKRASAARTQPPAAGCSYDHWSAWDLRRRVQPRNGPAQAPAAAGGVFLVSYRHFSEAEADSLSLDVPLCEFLFRPLLHASSASSNYLHLLFRTISDWDLPVRELQFALLSWYCNCELKILLECSSVKKESVVNLAGETAGAQRKTDEEAEPASYIGSAIYDTLFGGGSTSTATAGGANYDAAVASDVLPASSGANKSETADSGGSEQENACSKAFPALRSLDEIQRTGLFQDEEDSRVRSPSHVTTASSEPAAGTSATARTVHMRGLALAAMEDGVADALRPSTGVDGPGRQDDACQNEDSDSNREDVLWRELGLQVGDYSRQDAGATKNILQEQTNADMQEPNFVERPPLRSVEEILREAEYNGEELDYTRLLGATLSLENRFFRPWVHRYLAKKEHIHVTVFNHRVKKLKRRELGGCGLWPFVLRVFSLQFVLEAVRRLDGRCLAHVWLLLLQLRLSKDAVAVFDVAVQDDDPVPAGRTAAAAAAEGFGSQHMLRTKQFLTPAATAGGRAGGAVRGSPEVNKRSVLHMLGSDEGGGPALDTRTFVRELETDLTQLKTHALLSAVSERLDVVLKFAVSCAATTEETGIGLPSLRAHAPVVTFSRFQHCLPTLLVSVAEQQTAGKSTANIVKATKLHWQGILETSEAHLFGTSYFDLGLGVDPVLLLKLLPDAFRYDVDASGAQPSRATTGAGAAAANASDAGGDHVAGGLPPPAALVQTNHSTSITFVKEHSSNSEWVGFSGETTETNTVSVTAKKVGSSGRRRSLGDGGFLPFHTATVLTAEMTLWKLWQLHNCRMLSAKDETGTNIAATSTSTNGAKRGAAADGTESEDDGSSSGFRATGLRAVPIATTTGRNRSQQQVHQDPDLAARQNNLLRDVILWLNQLPKGFVRSALSLAVFEEVCAGDVDTWLAKVTAQQERFNILSGAASARELGQQLLVSTEDDACLFSSREVGNLQTAVALLSEALSYRHDTASGLPSAATGDAAAGEDSSPARAQHAFFAPDDETLGFDRTTAVGAAEAKAVTPVAEHSHGGGLLPPARSAERAPPRTPISSTHSRVPASARTPVSADPATTAKRHAGPHNQKCWHYFRDRIRLDSALCRGFLGVNAGLEDAGWNKALARALRGPLYPSYELLQQATLRGPSVSSGVYGGGTDVGRKSASGPPPTRNDHTSDASLRRDEEKTSRNIARARASTVRISAEVETSSEGGRLHDRDTENIKRVAEAEARASAYGPDAATRCLGLTQEPLLSLFVLNLRGVAPINQLSWAWIVKLVLRIDRNVGRLHELRTTLKVIAVCANARLQLKRSPTLLGGGSRSSSKNKVVSRSRTSSSATSEAYQVLVSPEARLPLVLGLALRDPLKLTSQALALADDWRIPGEAQASLLCHYLDNLLDDELERLLREPLVRVETLFFQNFRNYERICESLTRSLDQRIGIALTLLCRDSSEKHGMVLCLLPKSTLDRYLHLRLSAGLMDRFSGSGGGASPTATAVGVLSRASSLLEHPVLKRFESGPLGQCRQIVAKLKTQL